MAAGEVGEHRAAAAIADMGDVDAEFLLDEFRRQVPRGADARRADIERSAAAQRVDEAGQAGDVRRDRHDQHQRLLHQQRDRREIGDRVIVEIGIERHVDGVGGDRAPDQRVAVGIGLCDRGGADRAGRAGPVLDDDRLAERRLHDLRDEAG
jgi:hypothetical protein